MSNSNGNNGVLLVSTTQSQREMIQTGGIVMPSPKVNRDRVETTCNYVVCCNERSGDAFLIGMVDRVLWVNEQCVVKIKNYALITKPGTWQECGNKYSFGYLDSPSQMHLYVGRLKFKPIYQSAYDNVKPNGAAAMAAPAVNGEVKKSAIVTYPKAKPVELAPVAPTKPVTEQINRMAELRRELAALEAGRKVMLHQLIDAMNDTQIEEAIIWLNQFVK